MKIITLIFRTIRHYRLAFLLNLLGFSIAFAVFYILIIQVSYDWGFATCHENSDRIYRVVYYNEENASYETTVSVPMGKTIIKSSPHIECGGIEYKTSTGKVVIPNDTAKIEYHNVPFKYVTADYPKVFSFEMLEGDIESISDPQKALIPLSLAEKWFGKNTGYVGKKFGDEASWFLVVGGVYRDFPENTFLSNGIYQLPTPNFAYRENDWAEGGAGIYVRLDDPKNKSAVLNTVISYYNGEKECTETMADIGIELYPIEDIYFNQHLIDYTFEHGNRNVTMLLSVIAVLIVLIAGINYTNFQMAVMPLRVKSINTQKVLGASNAYLRMLLMLESIFMILIAFLLSLFFIYDVSKSYLLSYLDSNISFQHNVSFLLLTFFVALLIGVASNLIPMYRITSVPPALALKGTFGLSPKGRGVRNALIGFQFLIAFVVITVVLFMNLQFRYIRQFDRGFDEDQVVVLQLSRELRQNYEALRNKLRANPNIEDVALSEACLGASDSYMGWGKSATGGKHANFTCLPVSYNYLETMGIKVKEGRGFREEDSNREWGVLVFNECAKRQYNLELGDVLEEAGEIVGFIPDINYASLRQEIKPMAFYIWGKQNWGVRDYTANIRVSAGTSMYAIADFIRNTAGELDKNGNEPAIRFYDQIMQDLYERELRQSFLITLFSVLSTFIAIVGVFGLIIFETQSRRKEIGIRKIFGASTGDVLRMLNLIYIKILLMAFAVSIPFSVYITTRWLQGFAVRTPLHVWVFLVALVIVSGLVILMVTLRSWKAAIEPPINALHQE